jgi:hypothetical protein
MTRAEQIQHFAERVHAELWKNGFPQGRSLVPAKIVTRQITPGADSVTGYHHDTDTIEITYDEGDIEDALRDADGTLNQFIDHGWSGIRQDVIHETLHEYQNKVLETATAEGLALYAQRKRKAADHGHDAVFYSAIAHFAPHLELPASDIEMRL